ncbi:MAG: glycosyltransferase family 4 protein [Chloroflexi bacterium]|nr:glycosyltransferase family 4 protein [Chloroflexota bacterium]
MKIALVSPYDYPYPGGVTEHISHLDRIFRNWGHEVKIIAPCTAEAGEGSEDLIKISDNVVRLPFSGSISRVSLSPSVYRRVKKILQRERFDIVHLHEPMMPAVPLMTLYHSKSINVGTFHAYRESHFIFEAAQPILQRLMDKLHGKIAVSMASLEYISRYFPGDYVIIPNGVDVQRFGAPDIQPIERFNDGRPNILFVGRLEKRKGFRYLLQAYPYVKQAVPEVRLLVVGAYTKEDKEPFVREARRLNLRGIHFIGRVSAAELPRWYRSCDIFCAPSTGFESFGIVLLEAMAAGKPIVASSIAGYRTVMEDEVEGLFVEPENERDLADKLIALLKDPARRRLMGERGRQKAAAYSWERVGAQVMDYYNSLLDRWGKSAHAE